MPKNFEAIKAWVKKNRPDLELYMEPLMKQDAVILLMTTAFEAGRQFQSDNPTFPLNEPHLYLS
jgi:hypothetical protein